MKGLKKYVKVLFIITTVSVLICGCGQKNGFKKENGYTYYYVNGEKQTGWQEIKGDWYYFYETDYYEGEYKGIGTMKYGTWLKQDGNYYFFDNEGKMLRNDLYKLDDGNIYFFDGSGKMLHDTQKEINGKKYIFNSKGVGEVQPDYMLTFNCTFPKTFRDGSYNNWVGDVIIENITYEYDSKRKEFIIYWSGTAGNTWNGPNQSVSRDVGYKLYDPEGYVIDSYKLYTGVNLKMGEKFKGIEIPVGNRKVIKKGTYKLELFDKYYK